MFTWLSLVMSLMVSFCVVIFPRAVLDGIWDLIESVSVGFSTYFSNTTAHSTSCFSLFYNLK